MPQQVKLYQIPTATLAEQAIQSVQSALASLTYLDAQNNEQSWFSEIWGMCELSEEKRIPHFRITDNRYESAQPNNRQKAIGFFLLERDEILPNRDHLFEVSLIVWFNTKEFAPINARAVREYFITAIGHFIRRNHPLIQLLEVYRDKKEVWQGIDHDSFLPSDVPYSSFRIRFDLEWSPDCNTFFFNATQQILSIY